MPAYAIHDTDGGRHAPKPLYRHIYASETEARQAAEYRGYSPDHYPILPVEIKTVDSPRHDPR